VAFFVRDDSVHEDVRRTRLAAYSVSAEGMPEPIIVSAMRISLKKLALAFQGKTAKMMRPADAGRLTGYRIGGISPFAQKKRVPIGKNFGLLRQWMRQ
jgi:Cys-tRNA(Pro)/Cys-tRNA(Cys) deacylase